MILVSKVLLLSGFFEVAIKPGPFDTTTSVLHAGLQDIGDRTAQDCKTLQISKEKPTSNLYSSRKKSSAQQGNESFDGCRILIDSFDAAFTRTESLQFVPRPQSSSSSISMSQVAELTSTPIRYSNLSPAHSSENFGARNESGPTITTCTFPQSTSIMATPTSTPRTGQVQQGDGKADVPHVTLAEDGSCPASERGARSKADVPDFAYEDGASPNQLSKCAFLNIFNALPFWLSFCADGFILDIIKDGYKIPFVSTPSKTMLKNNESARQKANFVSYEINRLLELNYVKELDYIPHVVNPLTVAGNSDKPRLVLDLRHFNPHLFKFCVKFEALTTRRHNSASLGINWLKYAVV